MAKLAKVPQNQRTSHPIRLIVEAAKINSVVRSVHDQVSRSGYPRRAFGISRILNSCAIFAEFFAELRAERTPKLTPLSSVLR